MKEENDVTQKRMEVFIGNLLVYEVFASGHDTERERVLNAILALIQKPDREAVLVEVRQKMVRSMAEIPTAYAKIASDYFWELVMEKPDRRDVIWEMQNSEEDAPQDQNEEFRDEGPEEVEGDK